MDRTAFLERVRGALAGVEVPPLPASFPRTPASGDPEPVDRADRFLESLSAVGGAGARVPRDGLADAVAAVVATLPEGQRRTVLAPDVAPFEPEVDAGLTAAGALIVRPDGGPAWREEAARAALGVTSARLGVAATGSVLIASGAASPRAASILPVAHLVVMPADRLVPGLEEALEEVARLAASSSSPFLVTGPSRTSDIEMQMVVGVHGPRSLHVVLVDG
jgi:L-lactate dehydrogenase complex protein LldG